jgi:hypothetical protein
MSVPPVAMTDNNHRTVRCLAERDTKNFKVNISLASDVADLQEAIWDKGKHGVFRDVDAKHLILYKVRLIESLTN